MAASTSRTRLLVMVLVLHLGHMPFPWWDGDAVVEISLVKARSGQVSCESAPVVDRWDIDFILLGIQPPDDPDQGPVNDAQPHSLLSGFGVPYAVCRAELRTHVPPWDGLWPPAGQARLAALPLDCARETIGGHPHSYGATFAGAVNWRTLLSVITR